VCFCFMLHFSVSIADNSIKDLKTLEIKFQQTKSHSKNDKCEFSDCTDINADNIYWCDVCLHPNQICPCDTDQVNEIWDGLTLNSSCDIYTVTWMNEIDAYLMAL